MSFKRVFHKVQYLVQSYITYTYTSDITQGTNQQNSKTLQYADDMITITTGKDSWELATTIENNLEIIIKNLKKINLEVSEENTQMIIFNRNGNIYKKGIKIGINNQQIKEEKQLKFLGIIFDQKMNFSKHIETVMSAG